MVKTKCYGQIREFNTREQAIKFYLECIMGSEGSEQSRYVEIYSQLMSGEDFCTDEV